MGPCTRIAVLGGLGRLGAEPLLWVLGWAGRQAAMAGGGVRKRRSRSRARLKRCFIGQELAKASFMRRTLTVTTAPILRSFSRIVPEVTLASSVPARARRRT